LNLGAIRMKEARYAAFAGSNYLQKSSKSASSSLS
jgi:hypothetical protein